MTSIRKDDWFTFISNLPMNQSINEHMADILGLARFQKDHDFILASILKNPGLAMLLVDGFSDFVVLHNVDCLPENVFRSENKLVAFSGVGSKAIVIV
jgi:hypothetical protein